jgi:hypothetical protein
MKNSKLLNLVSTSFIALVVYACCNASAFAVEMKKAGDELCSRDSDCTSGVCRQSLGTERRCSNASWDEILHNPVP